MDEIAELMFEIISSAANVSKPSDLCWAIHYNSVWGDLMVRLSMSEKSASKIVLFRLRRLLFDKIMEFEKYPSFHSAKILGICLNVMGLKLNRPGGENIDRGFAALHKPIIKWVQKNYLKLRKEYPDVAATCLMGGISFDETENRLVKTYAKNWNKEPDRDYLQLKDVTQPSNGATPQ